MLNHATLAATMPNQFNCGHLVYITMFGGSMSAGDPSTFTDNAVIKQKYFDITVKIDLTADNLTFVGCHFASNVVEDAAVRATAGKSTRFEYCTFSPRLVDFTPPTTWVWPSHPTTSPVARPQGTTFAILTAAGAGRLWINRCNVYGYSNGICYRSRNFGADFRLTNSWIHDARANEFEVDGVTPKDHTDGVGYFEGAIETQASILIEGNTVASLGNTQGISNQHFGIRDVPPPSRYDRVIIRRNYMSGYGYQLCPCSCYPGSTNIEVTDNIFGTDVPSENGLVYSDLNIGAPLYNIDVFTNHNNNKWRRNRFCFAPGTSRGSAWVSLVWTSADHEKFVLPDGSLSATDWAS
jgi:hypothetical protein